jgi:hypothetical protein
MANSPLSVWDVRVVYATTLAIRSYIPRWTSLEFSDQLSDVGSGKITLDYNDTFVDQFNTEFGFGTLFDGSHAIQILRNQTLVFTFLIEDVDVQRAGYAQETIIAGRGIAAQLDWAAVLPENYSLASEAEMGEGIQLLPRELKGYEFLARFATTANLSAVYAYSELSGTLTASANGAFPTTDGITEIGLNDTILVKNQTNTAHNGVYLITNLGSGSTKWVLERDANLAYYDDRWCYVGARTFVEEGTANGQKAFQMDTCPSSEATEPRLGTTAITFSAATTVFTAVGGFYILFKEADTGYELSMQQGATWGDTRTGYGRGGVGNKVAWALSLDSVLNSSEGLTDSKGSTPKDGGNITLDYGKTLLETISTVCEQTECHWHVSPTGVISIARKPNNLYVVPFATDRTAGSSAVMLPLPLANSSQTKTSSRDLRSVVFATNSYMINSSKDADILATHGRRESFYTGPGNDTIAVSNTAIAGLKKAAGLTFGIDIDFVETEDRQAFLDFGLGDKVLVEYDIGSYEPRIVNGISVSIGSDMQTSVQLTFEAVIPDALVKLQNQSIYGSAEGSRLKTLVSSQPRVAAASIRNAPVPSIEGMSNRVSVSWETSASQNASGYEVVVYRTDFLNRITAASRSANVATLTSADAPLLQVGDLVTVIMANATNSAYNTTNAAVTATYAPNVIGGTFSYANTAGNASGVLLDGSMFEGGFKISSYARSVNNTTITTSRTHGFTVGQKVIIDNTGNTTVDDFAVTIISVPTTTTFIYANSGPDTSGTPAAATVKLIVEYRSTRVPARTSSAIVEGLATSGRPYLTKVISLNSNGDHAESTAARGFFSAGGGVNGQAVDEYALQVVGGAIKSPNYLAGNTGWIIRNDGSSEFSSVTVRGAITASTIDIGSGNTSFHVDTAGNIWSGNAALGSAPFKVLNTGALTATGANISGTITATSGTFNGRLQAGDIYIPSFASPVFSVTTGGALTATNANITGTITASSGSFTGKITVPGTATQFGKNINDAANYQGIKIGGLAGEWKNAWVERSDGSVYFNAQNVAGTNRFYMDSSDSLLSMGNGVFSVNNAGAMTATSGTIGGWKINSSSIQSANNEVTLNSAGDFTMGSNANDRATITSNGDFFVTGYDGAQVGNTRMYGGFFNVKKGANAGATEANCQVTFQAISFFKATNTGSYGVWINGGNDGGSAFIDVGETGITDNGSVSASGWFRSKGDTGWYNQTYGGGIYMEDTTWIRTYNNKNFYCNTQIRSNFFSFESTTVSDSADTLVRDATNGRIYIKNSSRDLKENIFNITNSLDTLEKLSPVSFNWKMSEEDKQDEYKILTKQTYKTMGFVLEDVVDISPELVTWRKKEEDGSLYPGYWKTDDFIALAIQGIKELNKKVSDLELELSILKG